MEFYFLALLDRRWAEERKNQIEEKQNEDIVFAAGEQIARNINKIAKRRTDIFGIEETVIGQEVHVHVEVYPHTLYALRLGYTVQHVARWK